MNILPIKDMANTYIEHSIIIHNFITTVGSQLKSSVCRVFGDSVKYKWIENENKPVIPDVEKKIENKNTIENKYLVVPRIFM